MAFKLVAVAGRASGCALTIDDKLLSRQHFQITTSPNGFLLEDLKSHNATYLNGEALREPHPLYPGDEIKAGKSTFVFAASDRAVDIESMPEGQTAEVKLGDSVYWAVDSALPAGERSTRDLKTLVRLGSMIHAFVTGECTREALAARLLELLLEVFPADRGAVLIYSHGVSRPPTFVVSHPPDWDGFSRTVLHSTIAKQAGLRIGPASVTESLASASVTSVIAAPIMARGEVVAVMYLSGSDLKRFLDDQHLELLVGTASLTSVAWENVNAPLHR